jgi:hypothetical protein
VTEACESIAQRNYIYNPPCRGSIRVVSAGYNCCQCDATYPVRHGVPILIAGITMERSNFSLADDLITRICAAEKIPDQPENRSTLREIFAWKYRLADVWLTAENNYYLKRVGLAVDGYRPKAPRINQESLNGDIRYLIPFDQAGFSLFFVSRSDLTGRDAQCGISARSRGRDQRV